MSKSHRILCVILLDWCWVAHMPFVLVVEFKFLAQLSLWITLPTQSCLVLYPFWATLLHSLNMWLIILSLSPHNLHLFFGCVLSILALIWLVLMVLFCAAIRRDLVSLLRFLFLAIPSFLQWDVAYWPFKTSIESFCFSSHFCFLVIVVLLVFVLSVLFLEAVISPSPRFSM